MITTTDLVAKLAEQQNITKVAARSQIDTVVSLITDAIISGDQVRISDLGTFKTPVRAARTGNSPSTGQPYNTPAQRKVSFTATSTLKETVKQLPVDGAQQDSAE